MPVDTSMYANALKPATQASNDPASQLKNAMMQAKMRQTLQQLGAGQPHPQPNYQEAAAPAQQMDNIGDSEPDMAAPEMNQ